MKWPRGISSAGLSAGIKAAGKLDVGVMLADEPVAWAGTFTTNAAAAAPVEWCKALLGKPVRAVVVNSGNANACTGARGPAAVEATVTAASSSLGCGRDQVLVASTGPIGVQLPAEKIVRALSEAPAVLGKDMSSFSASILTTDTGPKIARSRAGDCEIVGAAKGAAMLAPNMATMLAFIATDATIDSDSLQDALSLCVDRSFNCLSVDACESTNDSVFVLATGIGSTVDEELFRKGLQSVCLDLTEQMARDAEGASKVVRVRVSGAADGPNARELGRAVAASTLWRAAVNGADPNWGRILAAMGAADRSLDVSQVELAIGTETVFARGEPCGSLAAAGKEMSAREFVVGCTVGPGPGEAEILTTDLSSEYVVLNSRGTS